MKNRLLILGLFICIGLSSCCNCMNCPGSATWTGTGTDVICREDYEADPGSQSMSWEQYSDYFLQNGCTCID